jgi:hypothetical protein
MPAGIPIPPKQKKLRQGTQRTTFAPARPEPGKSGNGAIRVSKCENIVGLKSLWIYHLVMTNIAMENPLWRFVAGKIIYKWAMFHGYVK